MLNNFTFERHIKKEDVDLFIQLTGDDNPVHIDTKAAQSVGFQSPIVHGMLCASFISTLIGTKLPGYGSVWLSQSLSFNEPVYIGDTLTISGTAISYSINTHISKIGIEISNQHGRKVLTGEGLVKKEIVQADSKSGKDVSQHKVSDSPIYEKKSSKIRDNVLIVGGSGGIGESIALQLANSSRIINISYFGNADRAQKIVEQVKNQGGIARAHYMSLDNLASVRDMFFAIKEEFGPITKLVLCASRIPNPKNFDEFLTEELVKDLLLELNGIIEILQQSIKHFEESREGCVVNISSIYTQTAPPLGLYSYIATKKVAESIIEGLAHEYGHKGFRFNSVLPGMTETNFLSRTPQKSKLLAKTSSPLRKLGSPAEVAELVCFLLGDESSHITAEKYRIGGGLS